MTYRYLVVLENNHENDDIHGNYETLEQAKSVFNFHKSAKSYYCRLEQVEILGFNEDGYILGENETLESYFPEDEED